MTSLPPDDAANAAPTDPEASLTVTDAPAPPPAGDEPDTASDQPAVRYGPEIASHPHRYHVGVCTVPGCGRIEPMWLTNALSGLPAAPPRRFGGVLPAPPSAYSHVPPGEDANRPRPGSGFTFGSREIAIALSLVLIPILLAPVLVRWVAG